MNTTRRAARSGFPSFIVLVTTLLSGCGSAVGDDSNGELAPPTPENLAHADSLSPFPPTPLAGSPPTCIFDCPSKFATGSRPNAIAVDADSVYWTSERSSVTSATTVVWKRPIAGGVTTALVTMAVNGADSIALYGASVYFTLQQSPDEQLGVWRVPKTGGSATRLATPQDAIGMEQRQNLVVSANGFVYWAPYDDAGVNWVVSLWGIQKLRMFPVVNPYGGDLYVHNLATSGDYLFFSSYTGDVYRSQISAYPNALPASLVKGKSDSPLATDGQYVFYAASNGPAIRRVTISDGTDAPFATTDGDVVDLTYADGWVYWTSNAGTVAEQPVTGGSTYVIAKNQGTSLQGLAVGPSRTYWGVSNAVMQGVK